MFLIPLLQRWQSAPGPSAQSASPQRPLRRVKTPIVLQLEAVECGAAALGIILAHYGRIVPLAELRQACGVSREGSSAANVLKAGRTYGLDAKGFKEPLEGLRSLQPPYIVFWRFEHFLVVEGFGEDRVYLNDPASGRRTVSLEEFNTSYTGVVLILQPGERFQKGGKKKSIFTALRSRLQGSLPTLSYCVAAGFLLIVPNLAIPVFSQVFVDEILVRNQVGWVPYLLAAFLLAIGVQGLLTLLQLRYLRKLRAKLSISLSSRFIWHVLRLPISFYAQRFPGEISSRVKINDQVADALSGELTTTLINLILVLFYALVMLQYSWLLTLVVVLFGAINITVLQWVSQRRIDANARLSRDYGKVDGVAISGLQSIETLKASGLESDFFARWAGFYTKATNARQDLQSVNQKLGVLPNFLTALSTVALLSIGGWLIIQGQLTIGMLLAFQLLTTNFLTPINSLVKFGRTLQDLAGNLVRLDDVLENEPDPVLQLAQVTEAQAIVTPASTVAGIGGPVPAIAPHLRTDRSDVAYAVPHRLKGFIDLKAVTFGYSPVAPPLIEDFSLAIKPGQRVALVGGSGSGKSTLAKVVAGLYEPWSGIVQFDGIPRSHLPRSVLTDSIAVVDQEILLFADTVRANLTLWDTTVPDAALYRACQDAAIHDVILSIPCGYDAQLSEGAANLSGGQRQRLEIARALVNNPSILIMDEATSALDSETEKIIDRNLRRRGCTCLIVAHRLSTIRDCDEIIVLDRGRVVQRGTHDSLWREGGHYAQLISSEGT